MKKINKKLKFVLVFLIGILFILNFVTADSYARSNPQYTSFDYTDSGAFESFNSEMCKEGQDFIIQIAPFGCTPAVVRSDLLEEQNVPVFCQLSATKINPLIKVEAIESISFSEKEFSQGVASVGFHASRAALGVRDTLNSQPILENIGYIVITLKQNKNESSMPEYVEGNLTARVSYDIKNAYGIGDASFYLPEMDDSDWENKFVQYGFWDSRGFLRAESVGSDQATISIYSDRATSSGLKSGDGRQKVSTVTLKKGQTSSRVYLPNFDYCMGNFELRLEGLESPDTRARLNVNGQVVEVVDGEKFLENKCWVTNIEKQGLVQKTEIYCNEDKGSQTFPFTISPKLNLSIGGEIRKVNVGDYLFPYEDKSVYLAYAGTIDGSTRLEDLELYFAAILEKRADLKLTGDEIKDASKLVDAYTFNKKEKESVVGFLGGVGKTLLGSATNFYKWLVKGDSFDGFSYKEGQKKLWGQEIKIIGFAGPQDNVLSEEAKEYYQNALDDYDSLEKSFAGEEFDESVLETYGENALYEKINLAESLGQKRTMVEFCKEFEENYPDSKKPLSKCKDSYRLSSDSSQEMSVVINNRVKTISLENVYEPSEKEYSAELLIRKPDGTSIPITIKKNQIIYLNETANDFIQLVSLEQDSATFEISIEKKGWEGVKDFTIGGTRTLKKDIPNSFSSSYNFVLKKVNLKQSAKVSVISNINNVWAEANFGFKVGIEKRSDLFKLSPEKTKDVIQGLNKNIKQWEDISKNLNTVVEGMKTACLGTGLALNLKNLWNNRKGLGIARYNVMRNPGGWYEKCTDIVKQDSNIDSLEQCFKKNAEFIERDVDAMYKFLSSQQDDIKNIQAVYTTKKLFSEDAVDTDKFVANYSGQVVSFLSGSKIKSVSNPKNSKEEITINEMLDSLSSNAWQDNVYTIEQLRDVELYTNILNSGDSSAELKQMANENLYYIFSDIRENSREYTKRATISTQYGISEIDFSSNEKSKPIIITQDITWKNVKEKFDETEETKKINEKQLVRIYVDRLQNKQYLILLNNDYIVEKTYSINGKEITPFQVSLDKDGKEITNNPLSLEYEKFDETTYQNEIKNPEVKYYETEPYAGLPAIVPFEIKEGWYAATTATLPVFGGIKAYDDSGRVSSFWLCNVGENGIIEFNSGIKDDICQQINLGTGQTYSAFAGLSSSKATKLVDDGVNAIREASRIPESKRKGTVRINGQDIPVGSPAVSVPDIQCQDFMSVKDCQILFNVCDPVICPSSRCDFGGAYPVKDVVQSGIIGSIALCLPNAKEGIYIPICLTGVKAGLDNLLSVETSYRDCLQKSLDSGEMVGICDEIHSVYLCEFLWKQALPLAKLAIPKLMGLITGQSSSRGGGEYLGVADAWSNSEKAINYFTQYYAENSFKAFQLRSTEDVGSEVCKVAISATYPGGGDFFSSLIKADSPHQFNGNFEEIPFTTVTNPPISQYKVYYHIYAGQDTGAYYQVYLRSGSESSYYQDTAVRRPVASGYVAKGDYASQTEDFPAPSGYKQMCIVVNGQEECGFKQVSTSFAVNYMKDQYIKEQATQANIKTAAECVSGTASVYSVLNMNIQSGVEEAIDPALYNSGVIRICATDAPDAGTDPSSGTESARWILVGSCGDNIGCWLDTKSVENAVEVGWETSDKILEEVTKTYLDVLRSEGDYLSDDEFATAVEKIKSETQLNKTKLITEIIDKVFLNNQKAELYWLRGNAFGELAWEAYNVQKKEEKKDAEDDVFSVKELIEEALKPDLSKGLSPVFKLDDGSFFTKDLYFRYFEDGWRWSNDGIDWNKNFLGLIPKSDLGDEKEETLIENFEVEDIFYQMNLEVAEADALKVSLVPEQDLSGDNQKILSVLKDYSYEEGLKFLVAITSSRGEGLFGLIDPTLSSGKVTFSNDKIFRINRGSSTDLYLTYDVGENFWKYSFGKVSSQGESGVWRPFSFLEKRSYEWQKVTMIDLSKTKWEKETFFNIDKELLSAIGGKNFYDGAIIIFGGEIGEREVGEVSEEKEFLEKLKELEGVIVPGKACKNCYEALKYIYDSLGLSLNCIYVDFDGKKYNINGKKIVIESSEDSTFRASDVSACSLNVEKAVLNSADKFSNLQPGDLISLVYGSGVPHNSIFIGWVDEESKIAKLFDWNGQILGEGEKDLLNKICSFEDFYPQKKYCKIYRFYEYDLSEDKHPFYQYWRPVDSTSLTKSYTEEVGDTSNLDSNSKSSEGCWTFEGALAEIDKILKEYGNKKYSYNDATKSFVDKLFNCEIILEDEYNDIMGGSLFNWEEDMEWVKDLLIKKQLTPGAGNVGL